MYYQYFINQNNPRGSKISLPSMTEHTTMDAFHVTTHTLKSMQKTMMKTEASENTCADPPRSSRGGAFLKKAIQTTKPKRQSILQRHSNKVNSAQMALFKSVKKVQKGEIQRIIDEHKLKGSNPTPFVLEMLMNAKLIIDDLLRSITIIAQQKQKRTECVKLVADISTKVLKLRNLDLKVIVHLELSKMVYMYKMVYFSIILSKFAKRLADSEAYLKYKVKAYKLLSLCFLNLRLPQAKVYATKYLMCSWKLNLKNDELKAYEMLGKYYYQEGNIASASLFHSKMVEGETLGVHSSLKRLGVAKLEQGSIGKCVRDRYYNLEDAELNISSDGEAFEVIFNVDDDMRMQKAKQQITDILLSSKKKSVLQHPIRSTPNFEKNNTKRWTQEVKMADQNIRQRKAELFAPLLTSTGELDLDKIKGIPRAHVQVGNLKNPVFLNHLSPNSRLANYQYLELNKQPSTYRSQEPIEPFYEPQDIVEITKCAAKLISIFSQASNWLDKKIANLR